MRQNDFFLKDAVLLRYKERGPFVCTQKYVRIQDGAKYHFSSPAILAGRHLLILLYIHQLRPSFVLNVAKAGVIEYPSFAKEIISLLGKFGLDMFFLSHAILFSFTYYVQ
jgi:hypothetical protein